MENPYNKIVDCVFIRDHLTCQLLVLKQNAINANEFSPPSAGGSLLRDQQGHQAIVITLNAWCKDNIIPYGTIRYNKRGCPCQQIT